MKLSHMSACHVTGHGAISLFCHSEGACDRRILFMPQNRCRKILR